MHYLQMYILFPSTINLFDQTMFADNTAFPIDPRTEYTREYSSSMG